MNQTIYVKLLNEGVDVWRPVVAENVADAISFLILPSPTNVVPSGEEWEFKPGSRVLTKEVELEGNLVKVAYKRVELNNEQRKIGIGTVVLILFLLVVAYWICVKYFKVFGPNHHTESQYLISPLHE